MIMKIRTSILIEKEVLTKTQQYGINVSKATENYLKILIANIEQTHKQIEQQTKTLSTKQNGSAETVRFLEWTGRDLNPRPPDCESGVHTRLNYRPFSAFIIFIGRVEFRFSLLKTILMTKMLRLWLTRIQLRIGC